VSDNLVQDGTLTLTPATRYAIYYLISDIVKDGTLMPGIRFSHYMLLFYASKFTLAHRMLYYLVSLIISTFDGTTHIFSKSEHVYNQIHDAGHHHSH
jgi:hypothetical protein